MWVSGAAGGPLDAVVYQVFPDRFALSTATSGDRELPKGPIPAGLDDEVIHSARPPDGSSSAATWTGSPSICTISTGSGPPCRA